MKTVGSRKHKDPSHPNVALLLGFDSDSRTKINPRLEDPGPDSGLLAPIIRQIPSADPMGPCTHTPIPVVRSTSSQHPEQMPDTFHRQSLDTISLRRHQYARVS